MGWTSVAGRLLGAFLLAVAVLAALYGVAMVGASLVWGLTTPRFAAIWFAAGLTLTAGFLGYFVRTYVAGQVLPVEYDISAAFRGGQGGL